MISILFSILITLTPPRDIKIKTHIKDSVVTYTVIVKGNKEHKRYKSDRVCLQHLGQILEELQSGYTGEMELIDTLKH